MPPVKKKILSKVKSPPKAKSALSIDVYGLDGTVEKTVTLPKEIFAVGGNAKLLAQYVRVYLANQRQGTSSTKTRSEVTGSTKKIYRQKGTGRARHGASKAPIFVGGGIAFGPKPRDYSLKMNKKQKRKALFYSLSLKAKDKEIVGVSDKTLTVKPQTKKIAELLTKMGVGASKVLIVLSDTRNNLYLSSRNIANVDIVTAQTINPYEVLNHSKILFTENAVQTLTNHFHKES